MSRSRNLKPGFFKNEKLVELPYEYRLLFAGLWTLADREGRMEDRPIKIKMELFPADNVDVNAGLQALHDAEFILRYEVDGRRLITVLAWGKHQNPHHKEPDSVLPEPPCMDAKPRVLPPCTASEPEANASSKESKPEARLGQAPENGSCEGGSTLLIPDSLNLIPDSFPKQDAIASSSAAAKSPPSADPCPHTDIVCAYHEILPELPRVRTWDADRQKLLRARWREAAERQSVLWWRNFFEYIRRCPFLLGQVQSGDRDPFLADLEWLIRPKNFRKVIEGKYERNAA